MIYVSHMPTTQKSEPQDAKGRVERGQHSKKASMYNMCVVYVVLHLDLIQMYLYVNNLY